VSRIRRQATLRALMKTGPPCKVVIPVPCLGFTGKRNDEIFLCLTTLETFHNTMACLVLWISLAGYDIDD
jgi:hypothetical protein